MPPRRYIGLIGTSRLLPPASPARELDGLLPQDTVFVAYPSRVGVFPSTPVERLMQDVGHCDAALTAEAEGCSAAVIDSLGDYGIDAMRAALTIPVAGAGEAGMAAASRNGRRFALVTVWPASMNFIPEHLLRRHEIQAQCIAIYNVGTEEVLDRLSGPGGYLADVREGRAAVMARITDAIAAAAAAGAEAVLLGCTCMSPIAAALAASSPIPVINPLEEAVRAALAAKPPARPYLREGRTTLVRAMVDAVADQPVEDCEVCIFEEETSSL